MQQIKVFFFLSFSLKKCWKILFMTRSSTILKIETYLFLFSFQLWTTSIPEIQTFCLILIFEIHSSSLNSIALTQLHWILILIQFPSIH